jgi:hypothetical protein
MLKALNIKETKPAVNSSLKQTTNRPAPSQKMTRKYSDNKYDNPEYDAKIEQQTLNMIKKITGEDITGPSAGKDTSPMR